MTAVRTHTKRLNPSSADTPARQKQRERLASLSVSIRLGETPYALGLVDETESRKENEKEARHVESGLSLTQRERRLSPSDTHKSREQGKEDSSLLHTVV